MTLIWSSASLLRDLQGITGWTITSPLVFHPISTGIRFGSTETLIPSQFNKSCFRSSRMFVNSVLGSDHGVLQIQFFLFLCENQVSLISMLVKTQSRSDVVVQITKGDSNLFFVFIFRRNQWRSVNSADHSSSLSSILVMPGFIKYKDFVAGLLKTSWISSVHVTNKKTHLSVK